MSESEHSCAFCKLRPPDVPYLVIDRGAAICSTCVEFFSAAIDWRKSEVETVEPVEVNEPRERIAKFLEVEPGKITKIEEWASVYWVKGEGFGTRFVSKGALLCS